MAVPRKSVQRKRVFQAALAALAKVILPVARILLRHGVSYEAFQTVAKRAFVRAASHELQIPDKSATASRVAVLTGMNRKDVGRLLKELDIEGDILAETVSRPAQVIAGWRRDPEFHTSAGKPAALDFKEESGSFWQLVRRYGNDVPPRALLDELLRVGAVERMATGKLRLVASAYLPGATDEAAFAILGSHVPDLLCSIEHNLDAEPGQAFFQRRVAYDNIPAGVIETVSEHVAWRGQQLLGELDGYLAAQDRDANPRVKGAGRRRVVLGMYFLEQEVPDEVKDG